MTFDIVEYWKQKYNQDAGTEDGNINIILLLNNYL